MNFPEAIQSAFVVSAISRSGKLCDRGKSPFQSKVAISGWAPVECLSDGPERVTKHVFSTGDEHIGNVYHHGRRQRKPLVLYQRRRIGESCS